jgi:hypothetical protein
MISNADLTEHLENIEGQLELAVLALNEILEVVGDSDLNDETKVNDVSEIAETVLDEIEDETAEID